MIRKRLNLLMLLAGIAALVFIVFQIGPEKIWNNIRRVSLTGFMILVALRMLYWILRTITWKQILAEFDPAVSFSDLFRARLLGHAVSQLTPTAQIGGETARIFTVRGSSLKHLTCSVVIEKSVELLSAMFITILAMASLFGHFSLPVKTKLLFTLTAALAGAVTIVIMLKQRSGFISWLLKPVRKLRFARNLLARHGDKIAETDRQIAGFYHRNKKTFLQSFLLFCLLTMLWVTEVHLTIQFIGARNVTFGESFLITTLGSLSTVFPFIPASLGVYEVTYLGVFALLRLSGGVAITLVLIRRLLALIIALFGLAPLLRKGGFRSLRLSGRSADSSTPDAASQPEEQNDVNDVDNDCGCHSQDHEELDPVKN